MGIGGAEAVCDAAQGPARNGPGRDSLRSRRLESRQGIYTLPDGYRFEGVWHRGALQRKLSMISREAPADDPNPIEQALTRVADAEALDTLI